MTINQLFKQKIPKELVDKLVKSFGLESLDDDSCFSKVEIEKNKTIDLFNSLPYKRSQRVSDSIKKEVASIFLFKVNDPRLRNITITNVVLSDDLSNAKIFYSTINSKDDETSVKKALDKSKGFIRTMLGKSLSLKKIPTISFFKDNL